MSKRLYVPLIAIGLFAIGIGFFYRVLSFNFVTYDDALLVYHNPHLIHLTWPEYFGFWTHSFANLYIPMTQTVWAMGAALLNGKDLGAHPAVFHAMNLILHALNGVLVFFFLRRFVTSIWSAAVGAIFFVLHPLHVEGVAWISGLKDVVFTFFAVLCLEFFCRYRERPNLRNTCYATLALILALAAKPGAVVIPAVAFLIDIFHFRTPLKRALIPAALGFLLSVPVMRLTVVLQPASDLAIPVAQRLIVALDSISFYLRKVFWPSDLTLHYGRKPPMALASSLYLYGLWFVAAVLFFTRKSDLRKTVWLTLAMFAVALLPTSGLVPFFYQKYSTVSDRFAYFALLAPTILFATIWDRFPRGRISFGIVLVIFSAISYHLTGYWRDDTSVVARMAKVAPAPEHSYNLARMIQLEMEGHPPVEGVAPHPLFPPRSEEERKLWMRLIELNYHRALELKADFSDAHGGLGKILAQQGRLIEAVASFQAARDLNPLNEEHCTDLIRAFEVLGKKHLADETRKECKILPNVSYLTRNK